MKIGQVLTNALNELRHSTWKTLPILDGRRGMEITIDPDYVRAIELLIKAGLKHLGDTRILVTVDHDIYLRLLNYIVPEPNPSVFFNQLEQAIQECITDLSSNWKNTSDKVTSTRQYGKNTISLEHDAFPNSDTLLRILAKKYGYYPYCLTIPDMPTDAGKNYIFGNKEVVLDLIKIISTDLSPHHFIPENVQPKQVPSLQKQSISKIASNYFSFYPNLYRLPNELKASVEKGSMEHIVDASQLEKYKGKIVIFDVNPKKIFNSSYFNFELATEDRNLRVGIINENSSLHDEVGRIYQLNILMNSDVYSNQELTTSRLKYAEFKLRLPFASELTKIKEAIAKSSYQFYDNQSLDTYFNKIDAQQLEMETMMAASKVHLGITMR